MDLNEYQLVSSRTASTTGKKQEEVLSNFCMGLAGETGELVDLIKKFLFHGHVLDLDKASKELGDVLWYVSQIALYLNFDLNDVAKTNIEKLKTRYPKGFREADSVNRVEYGESK